jgi:hypothetical protein
MKLVDALKLMKPLLADSLAGYAGLIAWSRGKLRAYDGVSSIEVAVEGFESDWASDGARLGAILKDTSDIKIAGEYLHVRNGRSNFKILLLDPVKVPVLVHHKADVPLSEEDWIILRKASQFKSAHAVYPWASCTYIRDHKAIVTNNIAAVSFDIGIEGTGMVPNDAVDILGAKKPDRLLLHEDCLMVERGEMSLRVAVPHVGVPPGFFDQMSNLIEATTPLAEGMSDAIESAVLIDGRQIEISPEGVHAVSPIGTVDVELVTNSQIKSIFDPRFLLPVLSVSTRVDWGSYPKPVAFSGPGLRGILVGRK